MRRIFGNLGWLLGGRGINAAFSLVYLALATRSLGLEDFGRFSLIVVLAQGISGLAGFSTWQAIVRWGGLTGEAQATSGFAIALDAVSMALGLSVAAVAAWSAPLWLPLPPDLRWTAFALCAAALLALRSTPTGILRRHDRYDLATAAEALLPATRALGAVAAAIVMPDITGFVCAWAVAELACASAHWWFALRLEPVSLSAISLRALPARHRGVWQFVTATNLSRTLAVGMKQGVQLLVGMWGGAALAGGFRVATQLGQALVQLGEAVSRALYPELVRQQDQAGWMVGRIALLALATGLLATGLAALGGETALRILAGPEFAFAASAMVVLAMGGALELMAASWDALLVARGAAGRVFVLRAVPAGCALALLPAAIDRWGLVGATVCLASASGVTALLLWLAARSIARKGLA
ncbi:MAG: lipopolysaccharide biosynthesis protein [Novosphingobium sp.]